MGVPIKRKAFAAIASGTARGTTSDTPNGLQFLVFSHPLSLEAGIQIPAGTINEAETPDRAGLREAGEETGLPDLKIVRMPGRQMFDACRFGRDELHGR